MLTFKMVQIKEKKICKEGGQLQVKGRGLRKPHPC